MNKNLPPYSFDYLYILCVASSDTVANYPQGLPKIFRPIMLLLKPLIQFFMLLWFLCVRIPSPDVFIVQVSPHVSLEYILLFI
jgi:hypothetical protein